MSASHHPTDIHLRQHRAKKRNKLRARIAAAPATRTGCARSKAAANLFTIPFDDERETASQAWSGPVSRSVDSELSGRLTWQGCHQSPHSGVDSLRPIAETRFRRHLKEQSMVRNAAIFLGTIVVLALAGVSHAQPAGITREMIATALPVEGAPLAVPGPYKVEGGSRPSARRAMWSTARRISVRSRPKTHCP